MRLLRYLRFLTCFSILCALVCPSALAAENGNDWWRHAVIYEIYPRSFADSNGDGVGDLRGIAQHLDYLKELGIDAIWITPFYPSPQVDFRYDISDYRAIDPQFGTMSDFEYLVSEAQKRDIRVINDLVLTILRTSIRGLSSQNLREGIPRPIGTSGQTANQAEDHRTTGNRFSAIPPGPMSPAGSSTTTTPFIRNSRI